MRSKLSKMEENYINKKSQSALSSQNISESTNNQDKHFESIFLFNIDIELNISSDEKSMELMKQYSTNQDSARFQSEIIVDNSYRKKNFLILIIILIVMVAIVVLLFLSMIKN